MSHSVPVTPALAAARGQTHLPPEGVRADFGWLVRLRWGALAGEALLVVGVHVGLGVALPLVPLLVLVAVGLCSNALLSLWLRRGTPVGPRALLAVMLVDALLLTALLALSGGPFNPFSILYLVNLTLGAILLPRRACWALVGASLALFGALFLLPEDSLAGLPLLGHAALMQLHLEGMWVAFATAAGFIVHFVRRVTRALAEQQQALEEARAQQARHAHLAGLATLAAGTAHELSTPLSTIAVASAELERVLASAPASPEAREDAALIRAQVRRCREVLQQLAAGAGHPLGEPLVVRPVHGWLEASLEGLLGAERVVRPATASLAGLTVEGPARALERALRGVVKNALQATAQGGDVALFVEREEAGLLSVGVRDGGPGMREEVRARVGEPFFTTKAPGEGMGLGLFLTRSLLEQLGGTLRIVSRPGEGTEVRLTLPGALRQRGAA